MGSDPAPTLTILLPCHDEERAIASVIADYRQAFPGARILVVDNASTDRTGEIAARCGADVLVEPRKGKARGVLTALSHVDTDLLLMADGDASYPAAGGQLLVEHQARTGHDMVTGIRVPQGRLEGGVFRPLHQQGTRFFELLVNTLFAVQTRDVFSGLRLFTRRFYSHVPILYRGFELEMELTIQAADKEFLVSEVPVPFAERFEGTSSKLRTVRDGLHILRTLLVLYRDYRPMYYFGALAAGAFLAGLLAGWFPVAEYFRTGQVLRFPLAILAASLEVIAVLTVQIGIILESGLRASREAFQLRLREEDIRRRRLGAP